MTDVVVSVRMPSSLVLELKKLSLKNHYKDLSEEIRSIVRARCLKYSNPYASELEKLRMEISSNMDAKKEQENRQRLMQDLQKILAELKNEK